MKPWTSHYSPWFSVRNEKERGVKWPQLTTDLYGDKQSCNPSEGSCAHVSSQYTEAETRHDFMVQV